MNRKSVICLLLTLALLLGLTTGCGTQEPPTSAESVPASGQEQAAEPVEEPAAAEPAAEPAEEPAPEAPAEASAKEVPEEPEEAVTYPLYDEPVSFSWLDIVNPDYTQGIITEDLAENEVYRAASELTGIQIEWDLRMDASTTYALIIAGGDYPDCWGSKLSDYYSSFETALDDEVIIDLTDLIEEWMPNYSSLLSNDPNLSKTSFTENGYHLSVMPIMRGYTQFGGQIRGDIVEELNLTLPETFDDMHDLLLSIKDAYPDSQPLILSKDGSQNCSWLGGGLGVMTTVGWRPFYGLNIYQVDGTVKLGLLEPEYREYLEMLAQWYSEGLLYRDFFTNNGMGPPQDAISSNTSFVWYGSVMEIPLLTGILTTEGAYVEGMTDVTRTPGETIHLGDNTGSYVNVNGGYAVSTDCEHPEYVLQYLDYFYGEEGHMAANFGVEGDTYEMVNGKPRYTDKILNNETYPYVCALFKFCIYEGPFALDVQRYYMAFNDRQAEAVERWEANRDEAWNMPNGVTLTSEETERRATLVADIGTYCSEMVLKFIVGDIPVDDANWDAFEARIEELGGREVIDISQAALDRYNGV